MIYGVSAGVVCLVIYYIAAARYLKRKQDQRIEELRAENLLIDPSKLRASLRTAKRIISVSSSAHWVVFDERYEMDAKRFRVSHAKLIFPVIPKAEAESLARELNCPFEQPFYPWGHGKGIK